MRKGICIFTVLIVVAAAIAGCGMQIGNREMAVVGPTAEALHIYSARHYAGDQKLFDAFTEKTGIQIIEIKGTAQELIERLREEGERSPADLLLTVDAGVLDAAKRQGALQPLRSETLKRQVPAQWRDEDDYWVGITTRARVIVYAKDRVDARELSTYEALTGDKWHGKLLVRSANNLYNQTLLSSFIQLHGKAMAEEWAAGIVNNLARPPEGGDRAQAKAIADGVGDVAIMNTYYIGQMLMSDRSEEVAIAADLGVFFPNQETSGTHVNISGAGVTAHAPKEEKAIQFLEFATSEEGQSILSRATYEFPVNQDADVPELLESWGAFKTQNIDYSRLGEYQQTAMDIFYKVGWE